jgi:long-chain fatty acid transport protein
MAVFKKSQIVCDMGRWAAALLLLTGGERVVADGFRNPPSGAEAVAMPGGRLLGVDDLTAIRENPANLTGLPAPAAEVCVDTAYARTRYVSPSGEVEKSREPWAFLPAVYAALPVPDLRCVFGLGVDVPFGRSTTWSTSPDSYFRYSAPYFAQLQTLNVNPTVAFKVSDDVSLGLGLDILQAQLDMRQYFPWSAISHLPEPDGDLRLDATGYGVGGNAGIVWRIDPVQQLALAFRSPIFVRFDGDLHVIRYSPATGPFLGATPHSDLQTKIPFPAVVGLGYRVAVSDTVHLEADAEWIGTHTLRHLVLDADNNAQLLSAAPLPPGTRSVEMPEHWRNTFTFGMGADWAFAPSWTARAGWIYMQSPVPNSTFAPLAVDADALIVGAGLGYRSGAHRVELACMNGFLRPRAIRDNAVPAYAGKYDFTSVLTSISYEYSF